MRFDGFTRRPVRGEGYAVRLDWPSTDAGAVSHDFTQFTPSLSRALRRAASTRRYWVLSPVRPLAVTVVPITQAAFAAHAQQCVSSACPTMAPLLGLAPAGDTAPARGASS
ncbi:hypothetical protein GCM10010399_76350 [Dactylosporangium fulvum]|uniref:Uncharacterized protein n=1 Tax=Dactylosporangium fulvum TaxID=53359 RepID=A0ABY5VNF6_9ACTN|nr:hypothetical protein [Dactylosporangium fulvum]UWP79248.1 hypothetical protein Dfulv_29245 [Dactylosporangium fulvum]